MTDPPELTRRSLLASSLAATGAGIDTAPTRCLSWLSTASSSLPGHNVRDFGAKGDGVTDDTAAFNRATQAANAWTPALSLLVYVPPGRYRLDGTVYVRKGQHLQGAGEPTLIDARRALQSTFVLGAGLGSGGAKDDPGGAPVQISDLQTLGGAPAKPLVFTRTQGFAIRRLFLSAVGTGIHAMGADGIIDDIVVDQALNGIVLEQCQNINVSRVITYLANYALTMGSGARDTVISASQFCYSRYTAFLLAEGAERIDNVRLSGCSFTMNEQFGTFIGYIHCRASDAVMAVDNCSFRNWPGYAVEQAAGQGAHMIFANCQFDAHPTSAPYNASTTSKGISTGAAGQFRFIECEFRNLRGEIIRVRGDAVRIALSGGVIEACPFPRVRVVSRGAPSIAIRDLEGLALVTGDRVTIPNWPGVRWDIRLRTSASADATAWHARIANAGNLVELIPGNDQNARTPLLSPRIESDLQTITMHTNGSPIAAIDLRTAE